MSGNQNIDLTLFRQKKLSLLLGIWDVITQEKLINNTHFEISRLLLDKVVADYVDKYFTILPINNNLGGKLTYSAGLTTFLILKYRPIIGKNRVPGTNFDTSANEVFGFVNGLAVCGEAAIETCMQLGKSVNFSEFVNNVVNLLHEKPHTLDSITLMYQSLYLCLFDPQSQLLQLQSASLNSPTDQPLFGTRLSEAIRTVKNYNKGED